MPQNIFYQTAEIANYYGTNRRRWNEFYPSERYVFERVAEERGAIGSVLDVGCASGGLGEALIERFGSVSLYAGVEINRQAVELARRKAETVSIPTEFFAADICDCPALAGRSFDLVTALSVADWNVDAQGILDACWKRVSPGGTLVMSLRLSNEAGTCDMSRSSQYIWFDAPPIPADAERAPYNVFNAAEAAAWLQGQDPKPENLLMYGYWGTPSQTARTPYAKLIFAVIALRKARGTTPSKTAVETQLPDDAFKTAT